jgi:hypothetical protein
MTRKTDGTVDVNVRERVPFGGHRLKLKVPNPDENYKYYWFNDQQDRLARAQAAGYQFVTREELGGFDIGDKDVHSGNQSLDSRVSKRLRDFSIYLMKIRREYWEQDQKSKELVADGVDEAIFGGGAAQVNKSYGLKVDYRPYKTKPV